VTRLPDTLGALKRSGYAANRPGSVKEEIRRNLIARLQDGGPLFRGVLGYEDSVMPQIVNALLARHNFILLGLRGQAKSRILRALMTLLDEAMPVVAGSEVNDDPSAATRGCSSTSTATTPPLPGWRASSATWRSSPRPT
jgi:magnesium chelatase subunit I